MVTTATKACSNSARLVVAWVALLTAVPGISADLEGSLALGATATDNLFQAPDDGEDDDGCHQQRLPDDGRWRGD